MRRVLLVSLTVLALPGLAACGSDDSAAAGSAPTTAGARSTTSTTVTSTTTAAPTTLPTTTTTALDPAQAPPCNVGEVKVDREKKVFYEPGDPRYGTVPPAFVICLPDVSVAQSEGFAPAPPG